MITELFIYYRVRAVDVEQAIAAVTSFQANLPASVPGLGWALSRRADETGEYVTLMESYRHAAPCADGWPHTIEQLALARLGRWIVGERHVERFVPCA